jgi:hypothetical protein
LVEDLNWNIFVMVWKEIQALLFVREEILMKLTDLALYSWSQERLASGKVD